MDGEKMKGRRSWMIALAVMVLAAGAMTAVYSYSQKEEKKQQENVADKDAGKDKGNKKEDGASDDFVATLPKTEEETSEKLAETDSIIKRSCFKGFGWTGTVRQRADGRRKCNKCSG